VSLQLAQAICNLLNPIFLVLPQQQYVSSDTVWLEVSMAHRELVVIGASAGGIEAFNKFLVLSLPI
jgi:hypothetical protein